MKLLFIGPQGSGKGTQAKIIAEKLKLCHISTGDLLRGAEGEARKEIDSYVVQGNLVPDELITKVLKQRIEKSDCGEGFILDGFPRNEVQVRQLEEIMKIDKVILINISDKVTIKRLSSRLSCKKCGAVFNIVTMPPKEKGICDHCSGELFTRDDDKPEAIQKRLDVYHNETEPILKRYDFAKIDGEQTVERVSEDILDALKDIE